MAAAKSKFSDKLRPRQGYTSEAAKESRAQKLLQDRRVCRAVGFSRNRNIGDIKENISISPPQKKSSKYPKGHKLEQWKEERKKQKLLNAKKKPAFVVGVVRHNAGSPYMTNESKQISFRSGKVLISAKCNTTSSRKQVVDVKTRAAEKQLVKETEKMVQIPADFKFKAPKGVRPLTLPAQPLKPRNLCAATTKEDAKIISRRVTRSMAKTEQNSCKCCSLQTAQSKTPTMTKTATYLADAVEATALENKSVPLKQEFGAEENYMHEKVSGMVTPLDDTDFLPIHYSPFVTKTRGASRIPKNSLDQGSYITPKKGRSLNTEKECESLKENDAIIYFRKVLRSETERLEQTNEQWLELRNSTPDIPEETSDLIDVAVGKARLLIREKLHQFGTLIDQCEAGSVPGMPGMTVKCSDLEGFWDMVYIQVEDVDILFKKLEEAKSRNWQKENPPSAQIPTKREPTKGVRKGKKGAATSSLRAAIAAARKKIQNAAPELASCTPELNTPPRFSSPIIVNRSSARKSVLQQVLKTEAYKQALPENQAGSMLELRGIGKDFSSAVLIRNDDSTSSVSDFEQHLVAGNKNNISGNEQATKLVNARQSLRRSSSRKVRFAGEGKSDGENPVQPMTSHATGRGTRHNNARGWLVQQPEVGI